MSKDDLAFAIARAIHKEKRGVESVNTFHYIRNFLLDLSMDELLGVASQYRIKYH